MRRTGEPYDTARTLFEPMPRCQAFAARRLAVVREENPNWKMNPKLVATAQCRNSASIGWKVCQVHGAGKKLGQPGGRPPTHGRYSKLPERLLSSYEEALEDPTLIELREELALTKALIGELLSRWGDIPPLDEMEDGLECLGECLHASEWIQAQDEYLRVMTAFKSNRGEFAALREVIRVIEQRRRLASTEVGRLQAIDQMLNAHQALAFLSTVGETFMGLLDELSVLEGIDVHQIQLLKHKAAMRFRTLAERRPK